MPGTRRTPIARQHKPPVSERAIRLFMKMQDRDRWWDLHTELRREVGAKLWEWRCIEDPHCRQSRKARHVQLRALEAGLEGTGAMARP